MSDKAPDVPGEAGTDTETGKATWEELGFADEQSMIDAAKQANDFRSENERIKAELDKEKAARSKTDTDYMRQAKEIGELRKTLKGAGIDPGEQEAEQPKGSRDSEKQVSDDDLLEGLSENEVKTFDDILAKPENAELKKTVVSGGKSAMAEFVRAYRKEAPIDYAAPVFARLKTAPKTSVPKSSIAKAVKELFNQHEQESRNNLAASSQAGVAPPDRSAKTTKQMVVGGVDADFFRREK